MRTIEQAAVWLKEHDPDTALTKTAIRSLVLSGDIPHTPIGAKRLVSLEDIEAYISGRQFEAAHKDPSTYDSGSKVLTIRGGAR